MKAIVVTDRAAGTAGMKLVERPDSDAARLAGLECANYWDRFGPAILGRVRRGTR